MQSIYAWQTYLHCDDCHQKEAQKASQLIHVYPRPQFNIVQPRQGHSEFGASSAPKLTASPGDERLLLYERLLRPETALQGLLDQLPGRSAALPRVPTPCGGDAPGAIPLRGAAEDCDVRSRRPAGATCRGVGEIIVWDLLGWKILCSTKLGESGC